MKNLLEEIKEHYPKISMEDGIAVYGMVRLLQESSEEKIRKIFHDNKVEVDEETENIFAMAKSIITFTKNA